MIRIADRSGRRARAGARARKPFKTRRSRGDSLQDEDRPSGEMEKSTEELVTDDMLERDRLCYEKEVSKYQHSRRIVLQSIRDIFPEELASVGEYLGRVKAELEYNAKREKLRGLLDAPRQRSLEIHNQLREMETQSRAKSMIAKRTKTRSDRRRDGRRTTKMSATEQDMEGLRTERRSLQSEIDEVVDKIRAVQEPQYASFSVWNRVYNLNVTLDKLLKMLPPSRVPVNS